MPEREEGGQVISHEVAKHLIQHMKWIWFTQTYSMEQDAAGNGIQQNVSIVPFLEPATLHCLEIENLKHAH